MKRKGGPTRDDGTTTGNVLPSGEIERRLNEVWAISNDEDRKRFLAHKDRWWVTHRKKVDNH